MNILTVKRLPENDYLELPEALSITDDFAELNIRRGGKRMKKITSIETIGSVAIVTLKEYNKFISKIKPEELEYSGYEALLSGFVGKLEFGILRNDIWITDKSILSEEHIQHLEGIEQILLNIPEGQTIVEITDHDLNNVKDHIRDIKIRDILK